MRSGGAAKSTSMVSALRYVSSASAVCPVVFQQIGDSRQDQCAASTQPPAGFARDSAVEGPGGPREPARCVVFAASSGPPVATFCVARQPGVRLQVARREARPRLLSQQVTELAVEVAGRLQQRVADVLERLLLEQEVFADARVKSPDCLDGQIVPASTAACERSVWRSSQRQRFSQSTLACERTRQLGLCQGLDRQGGRQPDHPATRPRSRPSPGWRVPLRPACRPARQWVAPRRELARPPSSDPGRRPPPRVA